MFHAILDKKYLSLHDLFMSMNFTSSLKEGRENSIESESLFRVSVDSLVIERCKYLPNKVLNSCWIPYH